MNHIIKDYDNDFIKDNTLLENTFYNNISKKIMIKNVKRKLTLNKY